MNKSFAIVLALFLVCCNESVDVERERQEIVDLMTGIEKAHFNKSAEEFYASYDEQWLDVRSGNSTINVKEEELPRTQAYLEEMEFEELVARGEPMVEISEDGKMASFIGAITLKGRYQGDPVFWAVSWQSVLRKRKGEWKIVSTANTEAGPAESAAVLLDRVRESLGSVPKELSIYALADCTGPERNFKTLVISNNEGARMEQQYGDNHIILGHGNGDGWMVNANSGELNSGMDEATKAFVKGHELHMLALRPELRYDDFSFKGFGEFNGKDAFIIKAMDALQKPVTFYYNFADYRPLGFSLLPADNSGEVVATFHNWEVRDKCNVFTRAIFRQGDEEFIYSFTDIRFDSDSDLINEQRGLLE